MPRAGLEAFVKLFADDATLKQQFGALRVQAEKAGVDISKAFEGGTARRAGAGGGLGTVARGPLGEAGRALGAGGLVGRLGRLADPRVAALAAVTAAVGGYVSKVKETIDAEAELEAARLSGDPGAVQAVLAKNAEAMAQYAANARAALQPVTGVESAVQSAIGQFRLFREELFGKGLVQIQREAEAGKKAATDLWRAFGAPELAIAGLKRSSQELAATAEIAVKAAGNTMEYSAAIDQLIRSKERAAEADKRSIELEIARLRLGLANAKITEAEFTDRLADAKERLAAVDTKVGRERTQIEQDRRRQLAEMDAAETEHTAKVEALARQQHDAIVEALGQIVETEAQATVSLEQAFRARTAIQQEQTRSAIQALEQETAARRRAIQARLEGAVGQDRVKLERELTLVTQEEATKRTQIETKAATDRLRVVRQAQQEQLAFTERVFAIQQMLGQRTLHEDLARQTAIAQGAQAGSQTQLKALEQVAQRVKALSDQAKQFLSQALSASDDLARQQGRESPGFVSRAQLATDAAERQRQLEEAQRTFELGGPISREDFQALAGGGLERFREQQAAGRSALARQIGESGAPIEGFRNLATPGALFEAQLGQAFQSPGDRFKDQVGEQFAGVVSAAGTRFGELETVWSETVDKMVKKAEAGASRMGSALYDNFKARLTRDLEREVKTF